MMRPELAQFDRATVPSLKLLRSMPADLHGVIMKLHDALKEMRSCVFRIGLDIMQDSEIAQQVGLSGDALADTLPDIIRKGMMARDDGGALFSPHMYDKLLRSEERAARKASADYAWQKAQETGEEPSGLTRKQITARQNGAKGGRKRKGETDEVYAARRTREMQEQKAQRTMPLMGVVSGGKTQTENPNKKPNNALGYENLGSSVSIDLEERDNNIPSTSISTEPGETETQPLDRAQVKQLAARIMAVSGLGADQAPFAVSFSRKWLGQSPSRSDLVVSAISAHCQKMSENGESPRTMGVFKAPVQRALDGEDIIQMMPEPDPAAPPPPEWQQMADAEWGRQTQIYSNTMREWGDFGRLQREWPQVAAKHGLPDCEREKAAYCEYFRKQAGVQEAA
ncbi:hypothetical protein NKW54_12295 [Acetobacter cerevisiae]|uniref:Uncharacterized protein n=1 Tax=Acetobacter cerevisiae TaxID=178900 RepID=A0ABT1EXN9_9PROT|nr:hypothetical protein [Acetobacter cerevisiae]MCP1246715.1 hypothetical protein [Acetobacter cerevisiae]MCP1256880.1 hypothetical protein [Acetobacter cerevisiae]